MINNSLILQATVAVTLQLYYKVSTINNVTLRLQIHLFSYRSYCQLSHPIVFLEYEHSESADLRHGSSIPGLSKPTIAFPPPLFHIFADGDPDHSQNRITCSLSHLGHILKISSKSVHNFLSYLSLKLTFHGSRRTR